MGSEAQDAVSGVTKDAFEREWTADQFGRPLNFGCDSDAKPASELLSRMLAGSPLEYRRVIIAIMVVFVGGFASSSLAGTASINSPSSEQVVAQLVAMDARRSQNRTGYTAMRHYTLDYNGLGADKHAEISVQVVASASGQKKLTIVSENGSRLLINRVLRKLVDSETEANEPGNRKDLALTPDNYDFALIGTEVVDGRNCFVLRVIPKKKSKFLYDGKIWVDARDFAVTRISAKPAKNPSFWISSVEVEHRYAKHGDMWLPETNRSRSKIRFGGSAVLAIDYRDYQLLTDDAATSISLTSKQ